MISSLQNNFIPFKEFITSAKKYIDNDNWILVTTSKNQNFLTCYGLILEDVADMIRHLSRYSLYRGPEEELDLNHDTGTIYVFLQNYDIEEDGNPVKIYIKLKIPDNANILVVLSFHEEGAY